MSFGSSRYMLLEVCASRAGLTHACALQAFAGIVTVSVGHCHPKVVDAVKRQSELLQHTTTIYLNPQIALYAKELTDRLPGNLKVRWRRYRSLLLILHPQHAGTCLLPGSPSTPSLGLEGVEWALLLRRWPFL